MAETLQPREFFRTREDRTKDGQPLVWHDPTIQPDKCADTAAAFAADPQYLCVGKLVHDLTLAQIRTLDCGKLLNDFPDAEVAADHADQFRSASTKPVAASAPIRE